MENKYAVEVFKALADQGRLAILECVSEGAKCTNRIAEELKTTASRVSYHVVRLRYAGLVMSQRDGQKILSVATDRGRSVVEFVKKLK